MVQLYFICCMLLPALGSLVFPTIIGYLPEKEPRAKAPSRIEPSVRGHKVALCLFEVLPS
jgi:hypothetical protein